MGFRYDNRGKHENEKIQATLKIILIDIHFHKNEIHVPPSLTFHDVPKPCFVLLFMKIVTLTCPWKFQCGTI